MIPFFGKQKQKVVPSTDWTTRVPKDQLLMRWVSSDGKERIYAVHRLDGMFSLFSEYFSDDPYDMCWIAGNDQGSYYNSLEITIQEINSSYPWTKDAKPQYPEDEKSN